MLASPSQATKRTFKRTPKQIEATKILISGEEAALFGGSRSGKTFIIIRGIIIRAIKYRSKHLIVRFRFNHAKASIIYDTLPKVLEICFPGLPHKWNKSDWFVEFPNGSQIWIGGIDDKKRVEKILGNEYSTIYINEASQIDDFDTVGMLMTRLAEKNELNLRMWYDFNPPSKKHWTFRYFVEGINPDDLKPLKDKIPFLVMNPMDNLDNLPETYLGRLDRLPMRQRQRFKLGEFTLDVDGALWDYNLIIAARARDLDDPQRTVVAIDPAVTNNPNSDECGIVVASRQGDEFKVDADYSGKLSTQTWAMRAIGAYNKHHADAMVAETNMGGDLVENVLRLNGFEGRFIRIHAMKGKVLRAEPIVALYEQNRVAHAENLDELESEMMEWVPMNTPLSPNRIDAAVYALTELSGKEDLFTEFWSKKIND